MEDEARNVYREVQDRHVLRTADVYQTEIEDGVTGYSDTLLSVVANFRNGGAPEGFNAQSMVGKSKRGEVALRLFAVIDPDTRTFVRAGSVSWAEPTSCATADSCTVCDAILMSKRTGELVCPSSDVRFTPATRCPTSMLTRVA